MGSQQIDCGVGEAELYGMSVREGEAVRGHGVAKGIATDPKPQTEKLARWGGGSAGGMGSQQIGCGVGEAELYGMSVRKGEAVRGHGVAKGIATDPKPPIQKRDTQKKRHPEKGTYKRHRQTGAFRFTERPYL